MRVFFGVLVTVGLISCDSSDGDNRSAAATAVVNDTICDAELTRFIKVTVSDIRDGITSFDAFRINEDGLLSHATWQRNGTPVVSSGRAMLGAEAYGNALNVVSNLSLQIPPQDGTILAQPAGVTYQVSDVSPDSIEYQQGSLGTETLFPLIDQWRAASTLSSISGQHYWNLQIGEADIEALDVEELGCEHPVSQALTDGIASDDVLLPAPEALTTFLDDIAIRSVFRVSTPIGRISLGTVPRP